MVWKSLLRNFTIKLTFINMENYTAQWNNDNDQVDGIIFNYAPFTQENPCGTEEGLIFFDNGDSFKGQIKNCKMHGKGIYTHANGVQYFGYWDNNIPCGPGKYIRTDGSCFEEKFDRVYFNVARSSAFTMVATIQ
jgi:hypothetical protein